MMFCAVFCTSLLTNDPTMHERMASYNNINKPTRYSRGRGDTADFCFVRNYSNHRYENEMRMREMVGEVNDGKGKEKL